MSHHAHSGPDLATVADLISGMTFAMITTVGSDGSLHARPMAVQGRRFDGDLWFFTDAESGKAHEVEGNDHVNVSFSDPANNKWVSLSGRARLLDDRQRIRDMWNPAVQAWFPEGPGDPNVRLLHVDAVSACYWDGTSSRIVRAFQFAKGVVTGTPPTDMADTGCVRF